MNLAAAALALIAGSAGAAECPSDIVAALTSNTSTTLQKRDTAAACIGRPFTLSGTIENVDRDAAGAVSLVVRPPKLAGAYLAPSPWEVVLASPTACGDPARLERGAAVTVRANLSGFPGAMNRYASGRDGTCK